MLDEVKHLYGTSTQLSKLKLVSCHDRHINVNVYECNMY